MKKLISLLLITIVLLSIMVVNIYAETMCPVCGNHTVNYYIYTRYKANSSKNKLYAQNCVKNGHNYNIYSYCVSGGSFYGSATVSDTLYDIHVYNTEAEMISKYEEDIMEEDRLKNPSILESINNFWSEVMENDRLFWQQLNNDISSAWQDISSTFVDGLNYIGEKVTTFKQGIDLGKSLMKEYGGYLLGSVRTMFPSEVGEIGEGENVINITENYQYDIDIDLSNNISNDYRRAFRYDYYINRVSEENPYVYNIRIYDFKNNNCIYEEEIEAEYDSVEDTYYLNIDNVLDNEKNSLGNSMIPRDRGTYITEFYSCLWDNNNQYIKNNTYMPKSSGGTGGLSGTETPVSTNKYTIADEKDIEKLKTPTESHNPDVLGALAGLTSILNNIKDFFTTDLPNLGSAFSGLGNSVGNAVSKAIDKFQIPTGFALGLPKLIILIGGVLIALTGVVSRFIVFISTLWNVEPTSELLNQGMIDGLNYVRSIQIPIFGNLITLTFSMVSIFTAFMLIKLIRRNEVNG